MPKIAYKEHRFNAASRDVIRQANTIIAEYAAMGYDLTLRQLYYQFVSRDLLANKDSEYKRLGATISEGRLAGLIDWNAIVDRTRNIQKNPHWITPREIIYSAADSYAIDRWSTQYYRVEVWIEKDALSGVFGPVCEELDIPWFACRGYTSQSEMWAAGQRLRRYVDGGQTPIILHFGDHDPSGLDMTRDISERLEMFMGGLEVSRLALNMAQVDLYSPPPNPAKLTDARASAYVAEYGDQSWELDALAPNVLADLVRAEIRGYVDANMWDEDTERQEAERKLLTATASRWSDVVELVGGEL